MDDSPEDNAHKDGLDELTTELATLLAAHSDTPTPARASRTNPSRELLDQLAAGARRRRRRAALGVGGAVLVALAAGFAARAVRDSGAAPLSYTVDGAAPSAGGYVRSLTAAQPVLAFSDGTRIQMMPRTRARVVEVGRRGARIVLEDGRAHVEVAHRPDAQWLFEAGAFLIHVHGTAFVLEWNAEQTRLDVHMESGVVSVDGPRSGESVVLRGGQALSVSLRDRGAAPPGAGPAARAVAPLIPALPAEAPAPPEPAPRAAPAPGATPASWSARLAEGDAAAIVAEAEHRGLRRVLAHSGSEDLAALADAARYQRRDTLARRVLLAQRRRFPHAARAEEASFLLGRLEDRAAGNEGAALSWYDRYLHDAPRGTYAAEALGRKMVVLQRQHREAEARAIAVDYLQRFPGGTYAHAARLLVPPP